MKTRFLPLATESLASDGELVIQVCIGELGPLVLELAMLQEGLVSSLRLRPSRGPSVLLTLIDHDRLPKAVATREADGGVHFALGRNQVNVLRGFSLRAYRDGVADVNHLHIEGALESSEYYDLTVMFDVYRAPLSPAEAAKRLGD